MTWHYSMKPELQLCILNITYARSGHSTFHKHHKNTKITFFFVPEGPDL